jgi:hypothetical protein
MKRILKSMRSLARGAILAATLPCMAHATYA